MARLLVAGVLLACTVSGCGALQFYPTDQQYQVVLQIADQDGLPVANAAVWIDQNLMEERSAAEFSMLGAGFPSTWQGWAYNFLSPKLKVRIDYEGDSDQVQVIVSKSGYRTQDFSWEVSEQSETQFFRRVVLLEPSCLAAEAP